MLTAQAVQKPSFTLLLTEKIERKHYTFYWGKGNYETEAELWLHGLTETGTRQANFYRVVRRSWGKLSYKRLEALERTRPEEIMLIDGKPDLAALEDWIARAKHYHLRMKRDWLDNATHKPPTPEPAQPAQPQRCCPSHHPKPNDLRPKGTCQICKQLKLKKDLKGDGKKLKRICKGCRTKS